MKKIIISLGVFMFSGSAFAQDPTAKSFTESLLNDPMLPFQVVAGLVFILLILVVVVAVYLVRVLNLLIEQTEKTKAASLGIKYKPRQTWLQRFSQQMNASVPVDQEKDIEMDHSYDGIKELDNHLPPWWKWLFYGTIGWSAVYLLIYHFSGSLPLSLEEYQNEITLAEEQTRAFKASQPQAVIDENTLQYTNDAAIIANGKSVFMNNNCGSCHRNDGGGNTIGPNLTDAFWLHGGDVKEVFNTIKNGVVEKGMPAWGKAMSPQDVRDVTFFVLSLQGTNPPDAKAPQGTEFKQQVIMKSDSARAQAKL